MVSIPLSPPQFVLTFQLDSDLDSAAAAAASMGLEIPAPVAKVSHKNKSDHDGKFKSATNFKGKAAETDNDKRREELRSTGESQFQLPTTKTLI